MFAVVNSLIFFRWRLSCRLTPDSCWSKNILWTYILYDTIVDIYLNNTRLVCIAAGLVRQMIYYNILLLFYGHCNLNRNACNCVFKNATVTHIFNYIKVIPFYNKQIHLDENDAGIYFCFILDLLNCNITCW